MARRDTSTEIDAAAADWAARVDNAPLSPDEQAQLDRWLAGDGRRLGAYARARALFAHARRAKALGQDFDPDRFISLMPPAIGGQAEGSPEQERHDPEPPGDGKDRRRQGYAPSRRGFILTGSGAAVAAAVAATVGFGWQAAAQTYSTGRGEIRLIPLADGSSITLNTESIAQVRYGESERHVDLIRGEVLCDVVKDPKRPFIVVAGDTAVRAVGTSFSVLRLPNAPVRLIVKQGEIEMIRPAAPPERIRANTRTIVPAAAPIETAAVAPDELGRALAWREGMLSFEDVSLREAADEFARYSDRRISFADPAIGEEPVTGLYAANNPAGFARAVASSLDLHVETTASGVILSR